MIRPTSAQQKLKVQATNRNRREKKSIEKPVTGNRRWFWVICFFRGNSTGLLVSAKGQGRSYGSVKPAVTASYFRSGTPRTHSKIESPWNRSFICLTRVLSLQTYCHVSTSSCDFGLDLGHANGRSLTIRKCDLGAFLVECRRGSQKSKMALNFSCQGVN